MTMPLRPQGKETSRRRLILSIIVALQHVANEGKSGTISLEAVSA
jgi:hypothetical protein